MARFELEGDEVRPTLNLTPEEIAALEAEKREMAGMASVMRKSDRGRIRGHGTALEDQIEEKVRQLHTRTIESLPPDIFRQEPKSMASLDPETLGALAKEAKDREVEASYALDAFESARAASDNARVRLNDYMREHGLA